MSLRTSIIIKIWSLISFFCTLALGVILYVTFDSRAPFKTSDSIISIGNQNGANVLMESRGFSGHGTEELTIYRTFYHQSQAITHRVAIEGGVVINKHDEYAVLRSIVLPAHMTGAWCSSAVVYWRPTLSLRHHSASLPDLCFEVPAND